MAKDPKNKKKLDTKAKHEVNARKKALKDAKDAARISKIPARRSASVTTTATETETSSNGPEAPETTPAPDEEPATTPSSTAHNPNEAETAQGPSRERDIFDLEMSERATNPPSTGTDTDNDESEASSEDSRSTPTPTVVNKDILSATPKETEPVYVPGSDTPAPMPDLETPSSVQTTPKITAIPMRSNDQTPTPANQPSKTQSAVKENNHGKALPTAPDIGTTNKDEEELEELRKLMKESSEMAPTGGFRLNVKVFSPAKGRTETIAKRPTKPQIQWEIVKKKDLAPELCHTSSNNLDMMSKVLIKECEAAAEGRPHKLGSTSQILVEKGFKWLFKLMSFTIPKGKQQDWVTHAIRSVLAIAGISLSSMIALVELCKGEMNPHQWTLVSFTKEAYDAFADIRLLFDPRSQSAVSVREWTMDPPRTQILSIGAIITSNDSEKEAAEAMKCLEKEISNLVKEGGVVVTHTARAIPPKSGMVIPVNVHFRIDDSVKDTFYISPESFRGLRINTPKGTRIVSCKFGRLCPNCGSDSHVEKKRCPWITYKIGEKTINFDIPKDTPPGRVVEPKPEPTKKRKRDEEGSDEESSKTSSLPVMRDARPKPPTKRQKTDLKGKGRATSDNDAMPE